MLSFLYVFVHISSSSSSSIAARSWLWVRCGGHNSPPASSVMDLVFRRSGGSHVSVYTVHPSLLRSSSHSSSRWYHLQSLPSYIVSVSSLYVAKSLQPCFPHHSVILSTFSLSPMLSFLAWSISVWPHAHIHIFMSVTSSFFAWELVFVHIYKHQNSLQS